MKSDATPGSALERFGALKGRKRVSERERTGDHKRDRDETLNHSLPAKAGAGRKGDASPSAEALGYQKWTIDRRPQLSGN